MTVCGTSGAGKIIDPREAIVGRGAYLHARMHVRLLKPGWFTDTALSGSMAAYCMADSGVSVNLPMRQLSKEQSGDETGGAADVFSCFLIKCLTRISSRVRTESKQQQDNAQHPETLDQFTIPVVAAYDAKACQWARPMRRDARAGEINQNQDLLRTEYSLPSYKQSSGGDRSWCRECRLSITGLVSVGDSCPRAWVSARTDTFSSTQHTKGVS
ncbi:hypothetical protein FOXYSP1_11049 [Fusarium oxysporum f. sp. phaseoli]